MIINNNDIEIILYMLSFEKLVRDEQQKVNKIISKNMNFINEYYY